MFGLCRADGVGLPHNLPAARQLESKLGRAADKLDRWALWAMMLWLCRQSQVYARLHLTWTARSDLGVVVQQVLTPVTPAVNDVKPGSVDEGTWEG